ncbi:Reverse transcriptase (RNA-dependent DNA polymerase) [Bradyrhizobium sp. Ghvi]|uniref:reverse transcriptase domain-containing protein n=1 Tax=Bradyrhizobium sp. Ghvi TaxID=1855319 RepID=UPI0008F05792|nr:reverse transcriptase domain-containing protein [Bradyrhizobium sp. Ghvi]SFO81492.1 Reverse transcriptase (RNA-dependent DNA polymerase) [Bradyrhizobium sp. Ghvi]
MGADLYKMVRSRSVLHPAWAVVRASGLASLSPETFRRTKSFDANWLSNVERLARQLRNQSFTFENEIGVALPKGRGKLGRRPLVVAPIENRIVRRAILDVLQGDSSSDVDARRRWTGIPSVRAIMETPTSVGGIQSRGVPLGLSLIDNAVRNGYHWFIRSDIRDFFTRIPIADVVDFVRKATSDDAFCNLFAQALATNLANKQELEERNHFTLFPSTEVGVAQGSALSALAGNIVLREFDTAMNGRGLICVRYIDDFILLGRTEAKVVAAFKSAQDRLRKLGMTCYDPSDPAALRDGKVDQGNIHAGTDVLGYRISARSLQPSNKAQDALLTKLDEIIGQARAAMQGAAKGKVSSQVYLYHQAMVMMNRVTWGWSQSFKYTNAQHVLQNLDDRIDAKIAELRRIANSWTNGGSPLTRRRVAGFHLLQDCYACPLPELPNNHRASESFALAG